MIELLRHGVPIVTFAAVLSLGLLMCVECLFFPHSSPLIGDE